MSVFISMLVVVNTELTAYFKTLQINLLPFNQH